VGIRFKKAGKVYYFDPGDLEVKKDAFVIVETARGIEYGKVVIDKKLVGENDVVLPLKKVVRLATQKDILSVEENKAAAKEAFQSCEEKIIEHKLDMKLVDVEYTFDRNKIIFYFTADGRIDFRELVKDLASIFRTRIELRQIGVRDEAKMLGGIGPCGRMLCCSTFLGDFEPVSIMCCLKYENDYYEEVKEEMPDVGEEIMTPHGVGRVVGLNLLEKLIQVNIPSMERTTEFTLDELAGKREELFSQATE
jgi:cell fate regulator YaaT (PSP1 superfamily)